MRESFEEQFEVTATGDYRYRRHQKGEAIPVHAEEFARFVREYARRLYFIMGGLMVAMLAFIGIVIWWTAATESDLPEMVLSVGVIGLAVISVGFMSWVRGAPARELRGRTAVARERTKDEMRSIGFEKLTYGHLAGTAAFGLILPFVQKRGTDVLHGWGRLWLVTGAGLVLLAAVQAFRKWRYESERL